MFSGTWVSSDACVVGIRWLLGFLELTLTLAFMYYCIDFLMFPLATGTKLQSTYQSNALDALHRMVASNNRWTSWSLCCFDQIPGAWAVYLALMWMLHWNPYIFSCDGHKMMIDIPIECPWCPLPNGDLKKPLNFMVLMLLESIPGAFVVWIAFRAWITSINFPRLDSLSKKIWCSDYSNYV